MDLLRNEWLDAVQSLESELDPTEAADYDPPAARAALAEARKRGRAWLDAAMPGGLPAARGAPVALCAAS